MRAWLGIGIAALSLAAGCEDGHSGAAPPGLDLVVAVEEGRYAVGPLHGELAGSSLPLLPTEPRPALVTAEHERRPAVVLPPGAWRWQGRVPQGARLEVGAAISRPAAGAAGDPAAGGLRVTVTALGDGEHGEQHELVAVGRSTPGDSRWLNLSADLHSYAGQQITLEFEGRLIGGDPAWGIAWGPVVLTAPGRPLPASTPVAPLPAGAAAVAAGEEGSRKLPNVLFILVDTLRADHLSCYGYERPTTPRIDALLAEHGVKVETAYSQAPWTLPSVASFMTSRYPGEILGGTMSSFGIPPEVPTLAEVFAALGYETAGFNANPALFAGNGFDRGFRTFYTPPASFDWFNRHADDLNRRAVPWLRAHQRRPFFLYVHYLDPHDPYDNPDVVDGRSPFYPDYQGYLSGRDVHGVYAGVHPLHDPETDVAHLTALYDTEVQYVDRFVGKLIEALEPDVLAETLIVLTADHGEELYDHGGWKHGQALYDEQIRVPLLLRWDGRLPAGTSFEGTVELLDLLPTLTAAAGGRSLPAWQGQDLLPALESGGRAPRGPAFAQHMGAGPLRAAAVLDGWKMMAFDHLSPATAPGRPSLDILHQYLRQRDLERFDELELYDLAADPGEQTNLAGEAAAGSHVEVLGPVVHGRLFGQQPGLYVTAAALPPGSVLEGRVVFSGTPEGWLPYFLSGDEAVSLEGRELRFAFHGVPAAVPDRGVVVLGAAGGIESLELRLLDGDGEGDAYAVRLGDGEAWDGGAVEAARLRASRWPGGERPTAPTLYLWRPETAAASAVEEDEDPELRQRLRALGYLGSS